jgi:ribosomal protein L11 methyltransferase
VVGRNLQSLTEALQAVAPGGLTIEEPYVPLGPEEGARLEPWRETIVRLYLPDDVSLPVRIEEIERILHGLEFEIGRTERRVAAEDWAESWKEFFQVEHIGRHLVIRPTWREYEPSAGETVIDLDPGMAFGTGQHPTTRLCLRAIEEIAGPGVTVLDLGCGSGILSIAAAKFGCADVLALDIEQVAVDATRDNARLNCVDSAVRAELGSTERARQDAKSRGQGFDLVVANISASVLSRSAGDLTELLRPGGTFVGSGVVSERCDEVLLSLAAAGVHIERVESEGDWRAVIARV